MIIFQKFSLLNALFVWPLILKDKKIYLFDDVALGGQSPDKNAVRKILDWLAPGTKIVTINHEDIPEALYESSQPLIRAVDAKSEELIQNLVISQLCKVHSRLGVLKGIKMWMLSYYRSMWHMRSVAIRISQPGEETWLCPSRSDTLNILTTGGELKIPWQISLLNRLTDVKIVFECVALFFLIIFSNLNRLKLRLVPKYLPAAAHITHPYIDDNADPPIAGPGERNTRKSWSTRIIEDDLRLNVGNILYVYSQNWDLQFSPETIKRSRAYLTSRGGRWTDESRPVVDLSGWLRIQLGLYGRISLLSLVFLILSGGKNAAIIRASFSLIRQLVKFEAFCASWRPKAFVGLDDQSIAHVARTLVFDRYGLRNLAIIHSAFCGVNMHPIFSFVHVHEYLLYSNFMRLTYAPYWGDMATREVGLPRANILFDSKTRSGRLPAVKAKYGNSPIVLCMLADDICLNLSRRIDEFFETISMAAKQFPKVVFIMRPRKFTYRGPYNSDALKAPLASGRVIVETDDFSSYELIADCNLLICTESSSSFVEAISLGKPAIAFGFEGLGDCGPYKMYNKEMVAETGLDLLERIHFFLNDPNSKEMVRRAKKDLAPPLDGKVGKRIADAIFNSH